MATWIESLIGKTQQAAGRTSTPPSSDDARKQRIAEQQAVLNKLRSGQGITGAQPANPIIGGIQSAFGGAGEGTIPTLYAAKLGGEEVLLGKGAWNTKIAGSGPINVGGRTWYPAQSGQDLVYKPGSEAGKYGQILPSSAPDSKSLISPEDRAYEQEKSRVAQLAAQDELAKKYNVADLTKAYNTASTPEEKEKIGLQIWATTNPQLAAKLKPGQLGYEETQAVAASQSPLGGAMQAAGNMQFSDKISFGGVPATSFGVDLQTPLTGYTVPNVPQVGITESFKGTTPGGISFTEAAELFKGQLPGQADAAVLKKIFEQGLKK